MNTEMLPVFLLGAGFNADAKGEVGTVYGESLYNEKYEIKCGYPLVDDLARICFGLSCSPIGQSIESLFQESIDAGEHEPMNRLSYCLEKAEYYLVQRLLPARGAKPNCYARFFERFGGAHFLTFNYDSMPEIFLLHQGQWYPRDGYGVPVEFEISFGESLPRNASSSSLVLHLHGSFCIYTSTHTFQRLPQESIAWRKQYEQPKFIFDPGRNAGLFKPFERKTPTTGYTESANRVVAPIPDKTEGLNQEFISAVYDRAAKELSTSQKPLVSIGYSFNPYDKVSYHSLLTALESGSATVLVVSPEATAIQKRLSADFPKLTFKPVSHKLKSWVEAGFPGLQ